jgi:hypothetical protein
VSDVPGDEGAQVRIVWPEEALWPQGGYANAFLVNSTPWDFTMRFGHVVTPAILPGDAPPEGGLDIMSTPIAQITMPPPAFLQLVIVLQEQIAKYRAAFGDIGGAPPDEGIVG